MRPVFTPVHFDVSNVKCMRVDHFNVSSIKTATKVVRECDLISKFTVEHVHGYLTIDMGKQKFQTESEGFPERLQNL